MPGPIRKPAAKSQRRDRRLHKAEIVQMPQKALDVIIPEPPEGLLKVTQESWVSYWHSSVAKVTDPQTDLLALRRLFSLYDDRERCFRAYKKQRLVPGSRKQEVMNPLAGQIAKVDALILQLEDRFGLTPRSRLQLGIDLAQVVKSIEDRNRSLNIDEYEEDPLL